MSSAGTDTERDPQVGSGQVGSGQDAGQDAVDPAAAVSDDAGDGASGGERSGRLARLEEEGEVAADYLEELLDIADLDGDIDIDVEDGRAAVSVVAEGDAGVDLRRLAGDRGEVLDALQDLTRLAVQARTGERSRLMLDVAGHRARRRTELEAVAAQAVAQVRSGAPAVALEPMNPFERKVVHDAVAAAGLQSSSAGVEPGRHVVVSAAADDGDQDAGAEDGAAGGAGALAPQPVSPL